MGLGRPRREGVRELGGGTPIWGILGQGRVQTGRYSDNLSPFQARGSSRGVPSLRDLRRSSARATVALFLEDFPPPLTGMTRLEALAGGDI